MPLNLGLGLGLGRVIRFGGGASNSSTIYLAPMYGQSLALGVDPDGASVISSAVSGSYMANGGVRFHYDETGRSNYNAPFIGSQFSSIVALEEQISPNDADFGETFASGMAISSGLNILATSTARGAYTINQLRPIDTETVGWIHYANTYSAVEHGWRLAKAANLNPALGPMIWKQGEADGAANTTKVDYKTRMVALHQEFLNSLPIAIRKAMPTNWKMIIDQQAFGQTSTTFGEIAVAAIELHREYPDKFVCAGPTYWCEFTAINDVHMTSNGYRNYGEHLGRVFAATVGAGWQPCHITGVSRSGTTITVSVRVPVAPLVKDTGIITAIANDGFTYSGAAITAVTITDTGVSGTGTIQITIDADAGGTLGYAYQNNEVNLRIGPVAGPRGTIRDSESYVTANDESNAYNFLCTDQWVVA